MGGAGKSDSELLRQWQKQSRQLRRQHGSVVIPISALTAGLARHRALLFKVLADFCQIPCRLLRGQFYTGELCCICQMMVANMLTHGVVQAQSLMLNSLMGVWHSIWLHVIICNLTDVWLSDMSHAIAVSGICEGHIRGKQSVLSAGSFEHAGNHDVCLVVMCTCTQALVGLIKRQTRWRMCSLSVQVGTVCYQHLAQSAHHLRGCQC